MHLSLHECLRDGLQHGAAWREHVRIYAKAACGAGHSYNTWDSLPRRPYCSACKGGLYRVLAAAIAAEPQNEACCTHSETGQHMWPHVCGNYGSLYTPDSVKICTYCKMLISSLRSTYT